MSISAKDMPADDTGYGFDNIADVLTVSPTLMDRYINVAGKIGRMATGQSSRKRHHHRLQGAQGPVRSTPSASPSYNERASDDLPLDSRGGGSFNSTRPMTRPTRSRSILNANTPTEGEIDVHNRYEVKVPLKAGLRIIGVSFPKNLALEEACDAQVHPGRRASQARRRQPIPMNVQVDGARVKPLSVPSVANGPNVSQAFYLRDVMQISVVGPYDIKGPGDTPSRRKIFICRPSAGAAESACANKIIANLARHAYRRPVTAGRYRAADEDLCRGPQGRRLRSWHRGRGWKRCWCRPASCSCARAIRPRARPARCTASATWNWRRACPSSCGAAFPTTQLLPVAREEPAAQARRC